MAAQTKLIIELGEESSLKEYTFEFDRMTIDYLENVLGFAVLHYNTSYITSNLKLWEGALQKHHPELTLEQRDALFVESRDAGWDMDYILDFLGQRVLDFAPTTQLDTKKKKKKPKVG